jgi:epoxyqueuosine reductase
MQKIDEIITRHLIPAEEYIYGFGDLTNLLNQKFNGFSFGISIGKHLNNHIVDQVADGPTLEYYTHYRQMNEDLALLTKNISRDLADNGIESINIEPTVTTIALDTIYLKTLTTDLSHKMVATRAGLGWIGKTDLFISGKFGPRLRLASILLRNPVSSGTKPIDRSLCGKCNICVEACPAGAANGKLWDTKLTREDFFDAWKCRAKCAEFGRLRLGMDARVCGICVAVCPIGRIQEKRTLAS